ncbi:hypothetical protein N7466_004676, partial [Penicillium verhagenii]|uniref:uncharacterized protein n=1 Tax=Penicillium verhagenii TaxID=1562060 RepID=UPI002544DB45
LLPDLPSIQCPNCYDEFYYRGDLANHCDYFGHHAECETCPRAFLTWTSCNQHINQLGHRQPQFECDTCTQKFATESLADQHMNSYGHWKYYCEPCGRKFGSEANLRAHKNSRLHRGTGISCPFCKASFVTLSGVAHHVETGSCPNAPSLNRESLYKIIRESDQQGLITQKQIGWHEEEHIEYAPTQRAFNGRMWECYVCHKEFFTSRALTQHINSPVHKSKIYHCPNMRCGKEFTALAALFNHLESESCHMMRFENVQKLQDTLTGAMSGRRQIAF